MTIVKGQEPDIVHRPEEAEKTFEAWCKQNKCFVQEIESKTYWNYGDFWAFVVQIWFWGQMIGYGDYGFHIHKDGSVDFVGRIEGVNTEDDQT